MADAARISVFKWKLHMLRERVRCSLAKRADADPKKCQHCRGRGWVRLWHRQDVDVPTDKGLCWTCRGTGKAGYIAIQEESR